MSTALWIIAIALVAPLIVGLIYGAIAIAVVVSKGNNNRLAYDRDTRSLSLVNFPAP